MSATDTFDSLVLADRKALARGRWRVHHRIAGRITGHYRTHRRALPTAATSQALLHVGLTKGIAWTSPEDSAYRAQLRREALDALIREEADHLRSLDSAFQLSQSRRRLETFAAWRALG